MLPSGVQAQPPRQPSEAAYGSSGRPREVGAILRCVLTSYAIAAALQLVALTSLSTPAGAHLWACLLDEAERTFHSVAAYAAAVVSAVSAVASAQLTAALGLV